MSHSPSASQLKRDVYRILAWSICLPVLAIWPFLSAMPAFSIAGGELSQPSLVAHAIVLLSGFWLIAPLYIGYLFVRRSWPIEERDNATPRGLLLGAYATVWTAFYLWVSLAVG